MITTGDLLRAMQSDPRFDKENRPRYLHLRKAMDKLGVKPREINGLRSYITRDEVVAILSEFDL